MLTAYNDAAGRPGAAPLDSDIGGQTLTPGVYENAGVVTISSDVTLSGGPNDVFIFQIAGGITQAANTNVILTGGAVAENIFWQSAGVVAIGADAHFEGIVLSAVTISLEANASVNGRLLSQTDVTLIDNDINLLPSLSTASCFRMLTTPAEGDSYDHLLANVHTQGAGVNSGKSNHFPFGDPNVWLWPNVSGDDQADWEVLSDLTATIPAGTGFLLSKFEQNVFNDPDSEGPVALSVNSSTEHTGDVSPPLNSDPNGFTLVGNPYYSAIDFNALTTNNLTGVAYIWDHSISPDGGWVSTTGEDINGTVIGEIPGGLIHSFQGFFVQNNGADASLTFTEASKSNSTAEFFGKTQQKNYIRLEMSSGEISRSAWMTFSDRGSFDQIRGDALQLEAMSANYAMLASRKADGTLFDIGHYPIPAEDFEVPLRMETTIPGTYTITVTDLELVLNHDLYFTDRKTNTRLRIDESFSYEFTISNGAAKIVSPDTDRCSMGVTQLSKGVGDDRFVITTRASAEVDNDLPQDVRLKQNYPNPFNPTTAIEYTLPKNANVTLEVYNMLGQRVVALAEGQQTAGIHTVNFDATHLTSGVYIYRLTAGSTVLNKRMTLVK